MDYISMKEAADKWGLTSRMVNYYCANSRIKGAVKISSVWVIPGYVPQPLGGRKKDGFQTKKTAFIHSEGGMGNGLYYRHM